METRTPRGSFIIRTLLGNFIFVFFCSTLLSFAQAQQPMVVIDFKDFSAAFWPYRASPGLQVLSANFSGGVLISGLLPDFQNTFYVTASGCDGCLPTITINFNQPVSNFSVLLMNATRSGEIYTINDDQGGQQQVILAPYGQPGEVRTASLPESKIRQVTISGNGCFGIDYVQFRPSGPVLLDPVDSGYLTGPQVTTNTTQLSQGGIIVQGAAADGVTQAVVRIPANSPGESLSVAVQNEIGNQDTVVNDGGLFALGGSPQSAASALNVTAVDTPNGPMAFVIYLSPLNFARPPQQYPNDSTLGMRTITFHVQSNSNPNYVLTTDASILRPPVVLVHGLWGRPSDWSPFVPLVNDSRFFVRKVDYSSPLVQGVTATNPIYLFLDLTNVHASALGFTYNYPLVDTTIRRFIFDFRHSNNAAAVRADVVAHSMGGDIVRTLALEPGYANDATYGLGPINKLITIGTPHLGTPLAIDLLDDADDCVRRMLALNHKISFTTVTTTGGVLNGAVGDLQTGSLALQFFDGMPPPFAMAMVSATENGNNLSGLNCTLSDLNCNAAQLRALCGQLLRDPVGLALTYAGWPGIFSEQASDAVVPLTSQVNGRSNPPLAPIDGIVHSAGMEELNFNGPQELDYPLIPATVINLLNESPSGPDFQ